MRAAMPQIPDILRGCKAFPCVPMGKVPATANGWKDATDDRAKLLEWQSVNPEFNWAVACGSSGLFVIDIDPAGLPWLEQAKATNPAFETAYCVKTPRGGFHYYWQGDGPSTASRIAPGVDTRGAGGYVVLPGSKTGAGSYEALGGTLSPLPASILSLIPEKKIIETKGLERNPDLDQPRNVAWVIDLLQSYVAEGRVSVEGQGGNDLAFRVAASILDKAVSPARCLDLLLEHWNPHCSPSWEEWELETVVRNAAAYGEETKGGSKGFQSNADAFAAFASSDTAEAPETAPEPKRRVRFRPMTLTDARKHIKPPSWLIPGFLPSEGTGILYGASGSFKSFLALDMALCLAHGIAGQWQAPPTPHKVLFLAGEQGHSLIGQRVDSWAEWQGGLSVESDNFIVVQGVPAIRDSEGWRDVREGLLEMDIAPDLIIVDTLARAITGMDENSNNDANVAIGFMEEMAAHYGAFVLAIHHTGKDESKGARGASAFVANIDVAMMVKKQGKSATSLLPKKMKDSDCPDTPLLFQVKEFGSSIVLEKTERLAEQPKAGKSRSDWSSASEVIAMLEANGGEMSHAVLTMTIAGDLGIEQGIVRKALNAPEVVWMRHGNIWKAPSGQETKEFDL